MRIRQATGWAVVALVVAAGCSAASSDAASPSAEPPGLTEAPVTGLSCHGPATAVSASDLEPIATDAVPTLPVTVTDQRGEEVTITDTSRILAVDSAGTLATTVYALGLGDQLVGRDVSTGVPELAHLPVVTQNGHELNGEAILNLNPSVVLTDYSIGPLEVQLQLIDSDIPVLIMDDQRTRDRIAPQIMAVAEALGVPDVGRELADQVERDIVAAEERIASLVPEDPADRLRMVFLYMRGHAGVYYWFGEGSGADDLINALGGIDVASETGLAGARPINAEGLVRAGPELFLMMTKGLESVGGVTGMLEVPGIAETEAGVNGCVVDMSDYQVLSFGPQYPATLEALADAIYLEALAP